MVAKALPDADRSTAGRVSGHLLPVSEVQQLWHRLTSSLSGAMPIGLGVVSILHVIGRQPRLSHHRIPSIVWQFLWNFFFGPYLIWKIRMIHDIYHWRMQTIMAIVAG